ncbi:hypothetical protein GOODEAATRI_008884 [Goodea atripinnis]|uniref:Uncharacterized protein n=1 Tax=Goodea atripinnis TaxID=208336 RepID=A0ABV0NT05_9TELE
MAVWQRGSSEFFDAGGSLRDKWPPCNNTVLVELGVPVDRRRPLAQQVNWRTLLYSLDVWQYFLNQKSEGCARPPRAVESWNCVGNLPDWVNRQLVKLPTNLSEEGQFSRGKMKVEVGMSSEVMGLHFSSFR